MKALLFDLDGTLLDTQDLILNSFRFAYAKVLGDETPPSDDYFMSLVGIPLKTQMEMISPEHGQELFEAYLDHNANKHDSMVSDFEGTEEALAALKSKGVRMAVVTSKRHGTAVRGLEQTGLMEYFEFLLGADDTAKHKPLPDPLLDAAAIMEIDPLECAYVGDSPYDMQSARAANMYAVGALWGMFSEESLLEGGAEVLLSTISELPGLVD